jgi:hypothetical protein
MPLAGQPAHLGPAYNALGQDYARRARANRPVQWVAPTLLPIPAQGPPNADHELQMIESLRWHIQDSLMEMLDDLPELKGICAKLPDAYEGEDNFDCLDNWLQGLLRHFKLHRLTGVDRDADWVLVT